MANVGMTGTPFRTQSSISNSRDMYREFKPNNDNRVFIGRVIYADYDTGTIYYTRVIKSDIDIVEGYAKMPIFNYGRGKDNKIYGRFPSVTKDALVLIVRPGGPSSEPYVVGLYADSQDDFSDIAPLSNMDDTDNLLKEIYPSGQVSFADSSGDYLRSFNGYSFFYVWLNKSIIKSGDDTAWDDFLYDREGYPIMNGFYKRDIKTRHKLHKQAENMALVHQSFSDIDKHRDLFMIDRFGKFRSSFIDKSKNSKNGLEIMADFQDGISLKRVSGFGKHKRSKEFEEATKYALIDIDENNYLDMIYVDGGNQKGVQVRPEGTYIDGVLVVSKNSFRELSDSFKKLQASFNPLNDEITSLGADFFTKLQSEVLTAQNNIQTMQNDLTSLQSTSSANTKSLSVISSNISDIVSWESSTNTTLQNLSSSISKNSDNIKAIDSRVSRVEGRIPSTSTGNIVTEDYLTSYAAQNFVTLSDFNQLKSEYNTLNSSYTTLSADYTNLSSKLDALTTRVSKLENKS